MFSAWQTSFQRWLKADRRRITWVLILIVVTLVAMGGLLSWANAHSPAQLMVDGQSDPMSSPLYFVGVFFKLAGVLLLLVAAAYFARRWKGKETFASPVSKRQMAIIETLRLSPRQALHLVLVLDQLARRFHLGQ